MIDTIEGGMDTRSDERARATSNVKGSANGEARTPARARRDREEVLASCMGWGIADALWGDEEA